MKKGTACWTLEDVCAAGSGEAEDIGVQLRSIWLLILQPPDGFVLLEGEDMASGRLTGIRITSFQITGVQKLA